MSPDAPIPKRNVTGMEVVILAGGVGSRLRSVVSDVPKPMTDIRGKPFLEHLIRYLAPFGVEKIVLSVCHKRELIREHFGKRFLGIPILYSEEETPLGTGGAIAQSLGYVEGPRALVLNGDTFFRFDPADFLRRHREGACDVTIGLKWLKDCARYGTVTVAEGKVLGFKEKSGETSGYINAGVYGIEKTVFERFRFPGRFSFETDFLQDKLAALRVCPYIGDGYFIDIGVPEDYRRAQVELLKASTEKA